MDKKRILAMGQLNTEQLKAFNSIHTMRDYFAIIEGYPGTGKTRLLTTIALYLSSLGYHVALGAATNEATDNLIEAVDRVLRGSAEDELRAIRAMRVYRSMHEENALSKSKLQRKGEAVSESDGGSWSHRISIGFDEDRNHTARLVLTILHKTGMAIILSPWVNLATAMATSLSMGSTDIPTSGARHHQKPTKSTNIAVVHSSITFSKLPIPKRKPKLCYLHFSKPSKRNRLRRHSIMRKCLLRLVPLKMDTMLRAKAVRS